MKPTVAIQQGAQPLPYHDYRERWLTDEWFWYEANQHADRMAQQLDREEVLRQIQDRREEVLQNAGDAPQSRRAKLFEMLADLTDEDGAATELDDLGDWLDDE